mmetsp:Transcript_25446/g.87156  ORF Transcript_25446/g.87156 Transcript_25446/m.87156 type:complete len:349 (-) Transcript_25446:702-1748(-)
MAAAARGLCLRVGRPAGRAGRGGRAVAVRASADDAFASYAPKTAFLFPGQGAQKKGMCADLVAECPKAKEMFDTASEVLGYDLLAACVDDADGRLNSTEVSQPAIYVASLAALEKLKMTDEGAAAVEACNVCAGLSLGEYTALTFAGAWSFEDGLKLVKLRGESMQAAADASPSGMTSVIGLGSDVVDQICAKAREETGEPVQIANYLCPGNYAVSGAIPALDKVEEIAKPEFKARMTVRLAVAGAFHTDFMAPAREQLLEALAGTEIVAPRIPVVSNVDVLPHSDPAVIRDILGQQLTSPVRWEDTLTTLLDKGLESSYEIGPGNVIAGIMKRINKEAAGKLTNVSA